MAPCQERPTMTTTYHSQRGAKKRGLWMGKGGERGVWESENKGRQKKGGPGFACATPSRRPFLTVTLCSYSLRVSCLVPRGTRLAFLCPLKDTLQRSGTPCAGWDWACFFLVFYSFLLSFFYFWALLVISVAPSNLGPLGLLTRTKSNSGSSETERGFGEGTGGLSDKICRLGGWPSPTKRERPSLLFFDLCSNSFTLTRLP